MRLTTGLLSLLLLISCGDDDASTADAAVDAPSDAADASSSDAGPLDAGADAGFTGPTAFCPGSAGCEVFSDGQLLVGAGMADITPRFDENTEVMTLDVNGNGDFDAAEDEFLDTNGNGIFDGLWIAGFAAGRPASGVGDPQWARALVFENGDTRVALVSLDVVGFFHDDVLAARERLAASDVDYVVVTSTHTHEARDTMGRWGQALNRTGIDFDYQARIYDAIAAAVNDAIGSLRPANIEYASTRLRDQPGGVFRYVGDTRDPQVVDDEIRLLRFVEAGGEVTIGTLVNFASHPEYAGNENTLLSSDFAHTLRTGIEGGAAGPDGELVPGVGGITVYYQGAVGSQIGPGGLDDPQRFDGSPWPLDTVEGAHAFGEQLAYFSLRALGEATREETGALAFAWQELELRAENTFLHIAYNMGLFPTRSIQLDRPGEPAGLRNGGSVTTEVGYVDVGRARFLLIPGELDPALFVGGYDGSYAHGRATVNESATNPPDLSLAPEGPYLRDVAAEEADFVFLFGLANDELGYLIPSFDFELSSTVPYIIEAEGRHYQETVALGPDAWPTIERALLDLLAWAPGS